MAGKPDFIFERKLFNLMRFEQEISRRDLLIKGAEHSAGFLYAGGIASSVRIIDKATSREGLNIVPNLTPPPKYETEISGFNAEGLWVPQRFPIIVAHRAGNDPEEFSIAKDLGFTHVDCDFGRTQDKNFVTHGFMLALGNIPIINYDESTNSIRLFRFPPNLPSIFEHAYNNGIGVSAELKRGDYDKEFIEYLLRIQSEYQVPTMIHSKDIDLIEYASRIDQSSQIKWLSVPKNEGAWKRFMEINSNKENTGVLTNLTTAQNKNKELRNILVIVGDIDSEELVKKSAEVESINGLMGELSNLAPVIKS